MSRENQWNYKQIFGKQLTKFQISKKCAKVQKKKKDREREIEREKTQITNIWNNMECHYWYSRPQNG